MAAMDFDGHPATGRGTLVFHVRPREILALAGSG